MLELRSVDLSSNVIGFLKRESLQGLPKLSNLKLSNNELSRIGEGAFKEAPEWSHLKPTVEKERVAEDARLKEQFARFGGR